MVYISEWLPNPEGVDTSGEFVELFNNGGAGVNLGGWALKTQSGKKTKLSGTIGAGKYLVLPRKTTKLALKNTDEKILLYDPRGKLVDQSGFFGTALDGKSFSRLSRDYGGQARTARDQFVWTDPTPGALNSTTINNLIANQYPLNIPLNHPFGPAQLIGLLLASALVLAALIFYALKKHENLSNIFFGRDEGIWP